MKEVAEEAPDKDWSFGLPQNPGQRLQSNNKKQEETKTESTSINENVTTLEENWWYKGKLMGALSLIGKKGEIQKNPDHMKVSAHSPGHNQRRQWRKVREFEQARRHEHN